MCCCYSHADFVVLIHMTAYKWCVCPHVRLLLKVLVCGDWPALHFLSCQPPPFLSVCRSHLKGPLVKPEQLFSCL